MSKIISRRKTRFKSTVFGEYLMDRYFFKIETNRPKVGKIEDLDQKKLQSDNIITIVHEYLHYVHEISTHLGTVFLALSTSLRAILSNYTDTGLSSSEFNLNISLKDAERLEGITHTVNTLIGDHILEGEVKEIKDYRISVVTIKMPDEMEFKDLNSRSLNFFYKNRLFNLVNSTYMKESHTNSKVSMQNQSTEIGLMMKMVRNILSCDIYQNTSFRRSLKKRCCCWHPFLYPILTLEPCLFPCWSDWRLS